MDLYTDSTVPIEAATGSLTTCGDFSYTLFYAGTDTEVTDFTHTMTASPSAILSPATKAEAQEYLFDVVAQYGIYETIRSTN